MPNYVTPRSDKNKLIALILCNIPGGWHLMYVGRGGGGILRLFLTLIIIGYIFILRELPSILNGTFRDAVGQPLRG